MVKADIAVDTQDSVDPTLRVVLEKAVHVLGFQVGQSQVVYIKVGQCGEDLVVVQASAVRIHGFVWGGWVNCVLGGKM